MPIYKSNEVYLRKAIESVLAQTYSDFELIIVNDSPDDELRLHEIIASYNDTRIVWIPCKTNGGIAIASNIGIDLSQGKFIAMLDHDDVCLPNRFELQIDFLNKNINYGFIGGQAEALYDDGSTVPLSYQVSQTTDELKQSFFDGAPFLNPSVMFRKSALNNLRYSPHYKICTDYDLFARLVFVENIMATNLPETILQYRCHDNNLSLKHYLLAEQETNEIQQWIRETI